jgi:integrase
MPILPHNQRAIDSLAAVNGKRTSYNSTSVSGLTLEVMPSGTRTWRFRYRTQGGRKGKVRAYTIGDASSIKLGAALDKAREIKSSIQLEGRDPQQEKSSTGSSFEALFIDWLERHAKPKKKSWAHDKGMYERHLHSRLGHLPFAGIKRADVASTLDDIARQASGTQANRAQSLISGILNWAVNEGRIEHTPTYRLPKRGVEVPRERILSPVEIQILWRGLSEGPLGASIERIIRLALLTGQRRTEITEARKSELDLDGATPTWTIPGARTKNGVIHRVPLTRVAVQVFKGAVAESECDFVFPSRDCVAAAITPHAVTRAMSRLTAELEIVNATVHDLRRTVGTNLARLGVSKDIRARILNHVDGARSVTDAVYNQHEFIAEKRAAMQMWEDYLRGLLSPAKPEEGA